jgi:hypothetical protein
MGICSANATTAASFLTRFPRIDGANFEKPTTD